MYSAILRPSASATSFEKQVLHFKIVIWLKGGRAPVLLYLVVAKGWHCSRRCYPSNNLPTLSNDKLSEKLRKASNLLRWQWMPSVNLPEIIGLNAGIKHNQNGIAPCCDKELSHGNRETFRYHVEYSRPPVFQTR